MNYQNLLLVALPEELPEIIAPSNFKLIYTGVGKINAAVTAVAAINEFKPTSILNFVTAGAINSKASGLCIVKEVIQRDMLAEPLSPRGVTPFDTKPSILKSTNGQYSCATGDSFVTSSDPWLLENNVDLVDMELFGIAHVCSMFQIPWYSMKYVSDAANDSSAIDWEANTKLASNVFLEFLEENRFPH